MLILLVACCQLPLPDPIPRPDYSFFVPQGQSAKLRGTCQDPSLLASGDA